MANDTGRGLVERLRETLPRLSNSPITDGQRALIHEAADRIETLEAQLADAYERAARAVENYEPKVTIGGAKRWGNGRFRKRVGMIEVHDAAQFATAIRALSEDRP